MTEFMNLLYSIETNNEAPTESLHLGFFKKSFSKNLIFQCQLV